MTAMATPNMQGMKRKAWPPLLHRLVHTVRTHRLFEPGHHLLVSVSGGPDSVALLSLLHQLSGSWALTLTVAHFNYGLRGEESEADQEFVTRLCARLDVPLVATRLHVREPKRHGSLQAIARDLRYRALDAIADDRSVDRIALGHTADDQAETVLLWLLRGAGLAGLSGMPANRQGRVVRPLYDSTRAQVLAHLTKGGLSYRMDSTNAQPIYLRNRIRHELLPVLTGIAPGAVEALCRTAELCREDDRLLGEQLAALCEGHVRPEPDGSWVVDREFLRRLPRAFQRRLLRELFRRTDAGGRPPSHRLVEEARHAATSSVREPGSGTGRCQVTEREVRCLGPTVATTSLASLPTPAGIPLRIPSAVLWPGTGQTITVHARSAWESLDQTGGPLRILVDADRVGEQLVVRPWQAGDRFYPMGMKGRSKKLQDFFTDLKVPRAVRRRIPVVAGPDGIVWIVGYRQDERWAPTTGTQRHLAMSATTASTGEGAS